MFKRHTTARRAVVAVLTAAMLVAFPGTAMAADLTSVSDTVSDSTPSAASVTHVMKFTTTTAGTITKVEFAFTKKDGSASDFGLSSVGFANITGIGAEDGATTPNATGQTVVYTVTGTPGSVAAGTAVSIDVTAVTNASAVGEYNVKMTTSTSAGALDSATTLISLQDGVAVTANVAADLAFTLTHKESAAGSAVTSFTYNLKPSGTASDSDNTTAWTLNTNAQNGYSLTLFATKKLTHTGYSTVTIDGGWTGASETAATVFTTGTGFGWSTDATNFKRFAVKGTTNAPQSVSSATAAGQYSGTVTYKVAIDWTTPAGSYTSTVRYIATPKF